jgi:2-aminoadipate transaminase
LEINPDDILIISGSQQGLDFLGRIFIDEGDPILVERPGYLGAFHSFSLCQPCYRSVELREDGIDTAALAEILAREPIKLFYGVPNFQNPSGISYSAANRRKVAEVMQKHDTLYVEDDPYGELRFAGQPAPSMRHYLGEQAILLGSFSKIVAPGFRVGWIVAAPEIMDKLVIVKQASDLHTDFFAQRVLYQYVMDNDLDAHIEKIKALYRRNRDYMIEMVERYLPKDIHHTVPEGGMFLWMTLPEGSDTTELLKVAINKGVAFVPGAPFYATGGGERYLRVSFSYVSEQQIEEGIKRLAMAMQETLG